MEQVNTTRNAKEIAEERAKIGHQIKTLADKNHQEFTAEDEMQWQRMNADFDKLSEELKSAERKARVSTIEEVSKQPSEEAKWIKRATNNSRITGMYDNEKLANRSLLGWIKGDNKIDLKDTDLAALEACGQKPYQREYTVKMMDHAGDKWPTKDETARWAKEQRDLSTSTASNNAGYTIPIGFVRALEDALLAYFPALQYFNVLRTDSGNLLHWPTDNDTSNKGALLSEAGAITELDPSFSEIQLSAYKVTSKLIKVSAELLEDNYLADSIASRLGTWLGIRIARILADHSTTGTGSSQPTGIVTAGNVGVTTANPTSFSADELYSLIASLDPAYEPNAKFMMHYSTLWYGRKLKDSNGRYLFWNLAQALGSKFGQEIAGYEVVINQSMAAMSSGAPVATSKHVLFGDLSKMMVRWVRDIRFYQLNELYRANDQTGFVAFARYDCNLLDAGTHPVQIMQQHS
jgi:HK97 family phage major capsid protein